MMVRIQLEKVSRAFTGPVPQRALRDVTLTIEQGEWVSIEGPSGGGKSTLLNIIALLDNPSEGTYLLDGADVGGATEPERARLRSGTFGFIFQNFHLLDRRPVIDSVELGLMHRGVPASERLDRAIRALRAVGLESMAERPANTLSGGQRQRVAVARALASQTPVVVADEPTGNLDSESGKHVIDALSALHASGATIILVTHSSEIAEHAERRVRIVDGVLTELPAGDLMRSSKPIVPPVAPGVPSKVRSTDLVADAMRSLRSRLGRTLTLLAAVAAGIGLTLATLGVSQSAQAQVADTFDAHLNRYVTIGWPPGADFATEALDSDLESRVGAIPGVDHAGVLTDFGEHQIQPSSKRDAFGVAALAAASDVLRAAELGVRWAPGADRSLGSGEVLIGTSLADQMSLGTLDTSPTVMVDGRDVAVAGVIEDSPRLPALLGQAVLSLDDSHYLGVPVSSQVLILTRAGAAQVVARGAPAAVDPFEPASLTVSAPTDPRELRTQIEASVQIALAVVSIAMLLAAVISLANAMSSAIAERRQEFGLRRAVGALPRHVSGLVFVESTAIGLLGGAAGLTIGFAAILVTTIINRWAPVFDVRLAPLALVAGVLIGFLGGIAATARAIRIQPSEALRA